MRTFQLFLKRFFDVVVSVFLILALTVFPVLIVIPILIKLTSKGPAVFKQDRVGKNGKIFKIYKFRTMRIPEDSLDENGEQLPPKKRITKVGRFLRKTSLDELMQLFNILNGTMSIVGPRPTLPYQAEHYDEEQKKRLAMRPGITGWAQVNGRNDLSWTEKIVYDVEYVEKFSLWFDIKILFKTVAVVFKKEGIEFNREDAITAKDTQSKSAEIQKKALVVAGGVAQAALIDELKSRGIYTILADMNPKAVAVGHADKFYPVSTMDIPALKQLAIDEKVDYVLTACADQVLLVTVQISEELGLPTYIDTETAKIVSDKQYMKAKFVEFGVPTAKYVIMAELDESKLDGFEYPLIVKPVDCYSSRGVRKVSSIEELRPCFAEAVALSRSKTALVEEFCEGEELTIDAYVEGGKAHVLCVSISDKIGEEDRFVIYRTRHPSCQPENILRQIDETAQKIADAFGLVDSPMLIQAISDDKRIRVLEFCARTGGSIKFRLIKKASGFDVIKAAADLALGIKPHVGELKAENKYITNMFLYCRPGVFDHAQGFEELKKEGVISEYYIFAAPGKEFKNATCSGDRVGSYTVQADTIAELREKYEKALARVHAYDTEGKDMIRRDMVTELDFRS